MNLRGLFSLPAIDSCSLILSVIQMYFLHKDFRQNCLLLGVRYLACLLFGGFTAEVYSEHSQPSAMEFFCKNSRLLSTVNYICRKLHLRCLTGL